MSSDSSYDVTAAGYDGGAVEADAVFRALVTNNLQGFMLNIRGMMVVWRVRWDDSKSCASCTLTS